MNAHNRRLTGALVAGALALMVLPWYSLEQGFFSGHWLISVWQDENSAPALWQLMQHGWLTVAVALWLASAASLFLPPGRIRSGLLLLLSVCGILFLVLEGHAIGFSGWNWRWLENLAGPLALGQPAMGAGALLLLTVFLLIFSFALAERGVLKGDAFVVSAIVLLVALVTIFVLYPVLSLFVASVQDIMAVLNLTD